MNNEHKVPFEKALKYLCQALEDGNEFNYVDIKVLFRSLFLMKLPNEEEFIEKILDRCRFLPSNTVDRLSIYEDLIGGQHLNPDELAKFISDNIKAKVPPAEEMKKFRMEVRDRDIAIRCRMPRGDYGYHNYIITKSDGDQGYEHVVYESGMFGSGNMHVRGWFTYKNGEHVGSAVTASALFDQMEITRLAEILSTNKAAASRTGVRFIGQEGFFPFYTAAVEHNEPSLFGYNGMISVHWIEWAFDHLKEKEGLGRYLIAPEEMAKMFAQRLMEEGEVVIEDEEEPAQYLPDGLLSMHWVLWFKRTKHQNKYSYTTIMAMANDLYNKPSPIGN